MDTAPSVASTTPSNSATNVPVSTTPTVTFSEDVTAGTTFLARLRHERRPRSRRVRRSKTFTLDPTTDFVVSESCTVTVTAAEVTDQDGTADAMAADFSFSFTTADPPPALVTVHEVQGAAHLSPKANTKVRVEAVVTAVKGNGFWVQEEAADVDADLSTSEAVFVFTDTARMSPSGISRR